MKVRLKDRVPAVLRTRLRYLVSVVLLAGMPMGVCSGSDALHRDATRLYIGERKQFFFDSLVVESVQNVTRKAHRPVKRETPLIQADRPWEHVTYFTCNA